MATTIPSGATLKSKWVADGEYVKRSGGTMVGQALATVAETGAYSDLTGTPATPAPVDAQYLVAASNGTLTNETVVTAAGLALLDDANAAAQRTTLGLAGLSTLAIPDSGSEAFLGDGGGTPTWVNGSGTYTPTRSAEANLDSNVTPTVALWQRSGKSVTVAGQVAVNPTLAATATSFELSLPVSSNLAQVYDLSGVAFCGAVAGMGAAISGSVANNTAVFSWVSSDIGAQTFAYSFTYRVI